MKVGFRLALICSFVSVIICVDRGNFKTCQQSGFCKRHRNMQPGQSPYFVFPDSIDIKASSISLKLQNSINSVPLSLDLYTHTDNTVRLKLNEVSPLKPRYEIPLGDVLVEEPTRENFQILKRDASQVILQFNRNKVVINMIPFRVDILVDEEPVISINSRGLLKFEHLRQKKQPPAEKQPEEEATKEGEENEKKEEQEDDEDDKHDQEEEEDMWEETFKSHTDSKPNGPSSVGLDFSFPGYEFVYGIPEHADSLALKSTKTTDPYRLYNLDVFEYEVNNPMALYGSVPVMLAHNEKKTVGLFWLNAAETWVDISSNIADKNMFSKLVDFVKGDNEIPQVDTQWFSESGIIDVFIMLGPKPADVFRQYAHLTGTTALPPLFGIAYHQSRWNYNDEQDVASVDAGFDEHDIPLDVIWLDIEHTDGKRYFTWDVHKFPHSEEMVKNISAKGRKMVTIVDPHIKRDDNYFVYKEALDRDYFIKTKEGNVFEGWCWPGSSSWPDFVNPEIRKFWASKFMTSEYKGSTLDLFIWNDMNEPSVFNGPEITAHKDVVHFGGWEHRDVHNIYGLYVHRATWEGLELRSDNHQRPFVLSRAFFAGSQRYGAVWTGDNTGEWSHLKISVPMLLSLNIVGVTFSGADVGGFFKNPDSELLTRWYQAAAFQPFFRAHAHLDTRRREPWLLTPEHTKAIRHAIRLRYMLLPYWYTLFFNSEKDGSPIMKPLWVDFPEDKTTFNMDDVYLVGSAILVRPVVDMGSVGVSVYLPGPKELWYELDTYQVHNGGKTVYVPVDINKIPVFLCGGSIIPVRERIRRASILSAYDPYTFVVILDGQGNSKGDFYHDDFYSTNYKSGQYVHRELTFSRNKLTSSNLNSKHEFQTDAWIEKIIVLGLSARPSKVDLTVSGSSTTPLEFTYAPEKKLLTIRKPSVKITADFEIVLI